MSALRLAPVAVLVWLAAAPVALAHNVIAAVFPSGSAIEGEIGFSNGDMAVDTLVEVLDGQGAVLGQTRTDGDGFFLFTPDQPVIHVFRANLGAGHVAEAIMSAAEVAEILGQAVPATRPAPAPTAASQGPAAVTIASLSDEERAAIAEILRREMRPLRQEITALRNDTQIQQVLGGLGYICGLFGLGFFLAARRRLRDAG